MTVNENYDVIAFKSCIKVVHAILCIRAYKKMSLNHVDPILMCVRGWKILVRKLEESGQGTRAGTQFTHASLPND